MLSEKDLPKWFTPGLLLLPGNMYGLAEIGYGLVEDMNGVRVTMKDVAKVIIGLMVIGRKQKVVGNGYRVTGGPPRIVIHE
jgi:hypothetical protein